MRGIILEVKSCPLFSRRVAIFPDAVTVRGRRHIDELSRLSGSGIAGAILFLIQWPFSEFFMPEHHTDLEFSNTLCRAKEKIKIFPLSLSWNRDFSINLSQVRILDIPWSIIEKEAKDRGSYLLLLRLPEETTADVGSLGKVHFRSGYYIYIGSAKKNLSKRIERHKRLRKKLFWHIDHLREIADFHVALPIRTQDALECEIAAAIKKVAEWEITRFGSSDCSCDSHLFGTLNDPLASPHFHSILQFYRMERLLKDL